jgi:hypothetical protein
MSDPTPEKEIFDAYTARFLYEHLVGLTIYPNGSSLWLSWDETVALYEWLGQKIEEASVPDFGAALRAERERRAAGKEQNS